MIIRALKNGLTYIYKKVERIIRKLLDKNSIEELAEEIPDNLNKKISLLLTEVHSVEEPHLIRKVIKAPEDYNSKDLLTTCNNLG